MVGSFWGDPPCSQCPVCSDPQAVAQHRRVMITDGVLPAVSTAKVGHLVNSIANSGPV